MNEPINLIAGIAKICTTIMLAIALILTIKENGGTEQTIEKAKQQMEEKRFYEPQIDTGIGRIFVDRETGVCYYWYKGYNAGGLTVMLDENGKPLIWEEHHGKE